MTKNPGWVGVILGGLLAAGCGAPPPDEVEGYQSRCVRLNEAPIAKYSGDPHAGVKNVYACNVPLADLRDNLRPFPDGAVIVKESRREGETFDWLLATARRTRGRWQWDEYTRNFAGEEFRRIVAPQSTCTDCHDGAAAADFIFTPYTRDP